ncbi:MAG: rhodanese-like domain-containing protein [Limisphaera sp.]
MASNPADAAGTPRDGRSLVSVLGEAVLVLAAGLVFGWLANAVSPRGLQWTRNYFPLAKVEAEAPRPAEDRPASQDPGALEAEAVSRVQARGFTAWTFARVAEAFEDPRRLTGQVIWVDARPEAQYRRGHIPGARPLDPYRPEPQLLELLAACLRADQVIVYCSGGRCEDAELAATLLHEAGVPRERLVIYVGGFHEWVEKGQPVETSTPDSASAGTSSFP